MIETSLDLIITLKSSAIFGYLRFGNVHVTFRQIFENLQKSSESGRKYSENRQKRRYQYVYIISK